MAKMSITNLGVIFMVVVLFFTIFSIGYGVVALNGYDTTGVNESVFEVFGDQDTVEDYVNETRTSIQGVSGDTSFFDVIGSLVTLGIGSVKVLGNGADFVITGTSDLLRIIGINGVIADYIVYIIGFIFVATLLFAIILGRRDRLD